MSEEKNSKIFKKLWNDFETITREKYKTIFWKECKKAYIGILLSDLAYKTKTAGNIPLSIDIKYTTNYEFLLSGSDTILGKEARNLFRKYKITPVTYNESLTALFAAALAASGQGIAFTYYSSRHYFRNAAFLSLEKERNAIDLAVALSPGRYHSKAALALKEVMFKVLGYWALCIRIGSSNLFNFVITSSTLKSM